jgi:hypothetical protein
MIKQYHRFLLVVALIAFSASGIWAGDWATSEGSCYVKGDKILDVGIPFPFFQIGVHGAFDYAFHDAISAGGGIGFHYNYPYLGYGTGDIAYIAFVLRGAFHPFNLTVLKDKIRVRDKLDAYAGLTFFVSPSLDGDVPPPWPREFIGARWHFSSKISCFLEDCPGFGYLDGGISFNL